MSVYHPSVAFNHTVPKFCKFVREDRSEHHGLVNRCNHPDNDELAQLCCMEHCPMILHLHKNFNVVLTWE